MSMPKELSVAEIDQEFDEWQKFWKRIDPDSLVESDKSLAFQREMYRAARQAVRKQSIILYVGR